MNILKVNVVILYLCIVKSECGLLDSVLGTVKNTTNALRADIHNVVSFGNDLVFGGPKKAIQTDTNVNKGSEEPEIEGLFTNLYHKSVSKVHDFRQRLYNVFANDNTVRPHKGVITKIFDSVNKKLKGIQEYFEPTTDPTKTLINPDVKPYENLFSGDSKVVRDEIINVLHRNNTKVLNKLNISDSDLYNIFKDLNVTVKDKLVLPTAEVKDEVALDIDIRSLDV